jgi:glycosyltransferase involved in cell wall biosynthesis
LGCDIEKFKPDPDVRLRTRAALGLAAEDVLVLHLGWNWHLKGGDLLVAAASMLRERGRNELVFASVGAPRASDRFVRSLPFTERMQDLHQAADIFVSASRWEAFGMGLIEALSCGTVGVATLAVCQRETFEGLPGCIAVPVDDAAAIANGIEKLLAVRDLWPDLGAANRAHVLANYDANAWAERMTDFYENLLDHRVKPEHP